MTKLKKNIFKLFVVTITTILPFSSSIIACGNTMPKNNSYYWESKEKLNLKEKSITWDADKTNSIDDMFDQIDSQMKFTMNPEIGTATPFQFANYLLNFYNNNGGGNIRFRVIYTPRGSKTLTSPWVHSDFTNILKELISSFDNNGNPIKKTTPINPGDLYTSSISMLTKLGQSGSSIKQLLKLFGTYGADLFSEPSDPELVLAFAEEGLSGNSFHKKFDSISNLFNSLPNNSLLYFTNDGINIFSTMGKTFVNSKLSQEWAKDHVLTSSFSKLDHLLIRRILGT